MTTNIVSFDRDDDGGYDERGFGSSWDGPAHDEDDLLFGTSPTTRPSK